MPKKKQEHSEEIQKAFKDILKECKLEDKSVRDSQIKEWKKYEEYWHGIQYLFWSEREANWISPMDVNWREGFSDEEQDNLGPFYDYVVNIYRAHGEAIISALSAQLPGMRFIPDDADDTNDKLTARTYSTIADLICRHNDAKLIFLTGLFYLWNSGNVFSYVYKDSDAKYGTYTVPKIELQEVEEIHYICPIDGDLGTEQVEVCPVCGSEVEQESVKDKKPVKTGEEVLPKTRVRLKLFNGLQVKVPYYTTTQEEFGYLILFIDTSKSTLKSLVSDDFEDNELTKKIDSETIESTDRFSRTGYTYPNDPNLENQNLSTLTQMWVRPQEYWKIKDEKVRLKVAKDYPDGAHATFMGKLDHFVDAIPENMDTKWRVGKAGLSRFIHADAIGRPLMPISDMKNQLVNMTMDTIDHSNPSVFADPETLNFDEYGKTEALPGYVYKTKPRKPGEALSNSFYTEQRVSLSKEVPLFNQQLDQIAQFVVGAFPSVYGGPSEGKSRTFAEYAASRQMALQRLMIIWNFVVDWWVKTIHSAVLMYVKTLTEDERYTKYADGKYINVWIRTSELNGKVGGVEPQGSEALPVSITQKNQLLMKLVELNNPQINAVIFSPENASMVQDIMAFNELKIPGDSQRTKQQLETDILIKEEPIDANTPSLIPDPDVDDNNIHSETLKEFLVSPVGIDLKETNPAGYMNCILHKRLHDKAVAAGMMQQIQLQKIQGDNGANQ
jgi:hypothetical protein